MELKIGAWVAYTDAGFVENWDSSDTDDVCFPTKKDAIDQIAAACMDNRKRLSVSRLGPGHYWYRARNSWDNEWRDTYTILRITTKNIKDIQSDLECLYEE